MRIYETSVCFVTSHLAAHQEKTRRRARDFDEILHGLRLSKGLLTHSFQHLFWCGDLNYRIDLDRGKVLELVKLEDWATLRQHDQLIRYGARKGVSAGSA